MNLVESQREQVKQDFPGLNFIDVGKKLGEMWREMDPAVKKEVACVAMCSVLAGAGEISRLVETVALAFRGQGRASGFRRRVLGRRFAWIEACISLSPVSVPEPCMIEVPGQTDWLVCIACSLRVPQCVC